MFKVALVAVLVASCLAMPADVKQSLNVNPLKEALLGGALCLPCVQLIKNGETNTINDFNSWFDKEVTAACSPLGALKKECIMYFKQYEKDFDHFITTDADPKTSCQDIDFCSK